MYFYCYVYVFLWVCVFCSVYSVFIVLCYVLFVCKCVLSYCHRVSTLTAVYKYIIISSQQMSVLYITFVIPYALEAGLFFNFNALYTISLSWHISSPITQSRYSLFI